jgi:flagellar biosynthesis/type III secretory pathway protein FliH
MKKSVKKIREVNLKKPLYVLSEDYPLLREFSQIIDKFDEERDLAYFSEFYNEIMPAVNSIAIYVVNSKLAGINKAIDEFIFKSQKNC